MTPLWRTDAGKPDPERPLSLYVGVRFETLLLYIRAWSAKEDTEVMIEARTANRPADDGAKEQAPSCPAFKAEARLVVGRKGVIDLYNVREIAVCLLSIDCLAEPCKRQIQPLHTSMTREQTHTSSKHWPATHEKNLRSLWNLCVV